MKNRFLLATISLFIVFNLQAQNTQLDKANAFFENGQYRQSIPLYLAILDKEDNTEAKINLSEAYRQIGDYDSAVSWYGLVVGFPGGKPIHKLYYGLCLLWTDECEMAQRWFTEYLKFNPYDIRRPLLMDACNYYEKMMEQNKNKVLLQNLNINSPVDDYAPALFRDGIVYTSTLDAPNDEGRRYTNLYYAEKIQGDTLNQYADPKSFSSTLNTADFHEGIASFNGDQTQIFFTRSRKVAEKPKSGGKSPLEITSGRLLPRGSWSALRALPISSDEYSVAHPSITADGKRLFFSSNMEGGFGGTDLYLAIYENGQWGPPINLGPTINTPGNEYFPHISKQGKLYFSSDGHLGLGGQDLYWAQENKEGLWERPENLGYPLNSKSDDFGIILYEDGQGGLFTSNREGGTGGDDIYEFTIKGKVVVIDVVNLQNGLPVPGAILIDGVRKDTLYTNGEGQARTYVSGCTEFTSKVEGFLPGKMKVCETDEMADTFFLALALEVKPNHQFTGRVYNYESGGALSNAKVQVYKTDCIFPAAVFTDQQGGFNLKMEPNCCYSIIVEKEGFERFRITPDICTSNESFIEVRDIDLTPKRSYSNANTPNKPHASNIIAPMSSYEAPPAPAPRPRSRPKQESRPVEQHEEIQGFEKSQLSNEREDIYLLNVYYDVGRSSVSTKSVPELHKLLGVMKKHPNLILEIRSHTDSKGSNDFNLNLSQRRAEVIKRYLEQNGIPKNRLIAKGYGESAPVNGCVDGVLCTESQYRENRRTEFKVVGRIR